MNPPCDAAFDILLNRYSAVFIAAVNPLARMWKQSKCPATDKWVMKTWSIYSVKKNEIMDLAGKCMELEEIILSEGTQT